MSDEVNQASGDRLAKVIARAGVCSRREAESWITEGRVSVNGSPVRTPAFNVTDKDTIAIDGQAIARREPTQVWLYHKPAGLMVTESDPEGRPTVFEDFERLGLPRVMTVGRLDFNTEGLLLLTNDGGLKRTLELPATGWVRRYRVRAFGSVTQEKLDTLADGITVEGISYGPIEATLDSTSGSNVWLTLALREGKNREVRNVLGALGLEVNRLIRLSYGPFQLGDLPSGSVERVRDRILKDQLGKRLAEDSNADFDSPRTDDEIQPRRRSQKEDSRPTERDRYGGLRKRPDFKKPERRETPPRTVHFDDGRPSESFVPLGPGRKKFDKDDRPIRSDRPFKRDDGPRKPREDGDRSFAKGPRREGGGDRPFRKDADRPFNKGPRRDTDERRPFRDGPRPDGDRPFNKGPRREGGDRPFRENGDRPFNRRPRPEGEERPFARRPRQDGDGERSFDKRPPGRDSDRPFNKGPRREGGGEEGRPFREGGDRPFNRRPRPEGEDRPFSRGTRREGGGGDRPFNKGPRRDGGEDRPFRKDADRRPPRRDGDRPFAKGPRRDGDRPADGRAFEGPQRRSGPGRPGGAGGRDGKPGDRPFRPRDGKPGGPPRGDRPGGGRPGAGPRGGKPSGPRRPRGE